MSVHAVIAARGGGNAKSRLSARLGEQQRSALVEAMLADMLTALHNTESISSIWVVTPTPALASIATKSGANALPDTGIGGINGAFELARAAIASIDPSGTVLLLPGDIPLLSAHEINALLHASSSEAIAIAPANGDGGTGALALTATCPLALAFGPDSFAKHIAGAHAHGLETQTIVAPRIGLDIDRPADLDAFLGHGPCGRTGALLANWRAAE